MFLWGPCPMYWLTWVAYIAAHTKKTVLVIHHPYLVGLEFSGIDARKSAHALATVATGDLVLADILFRWPPKLSSCIVQKQDITINVSEPKFI